MWNIFPALSDLLSELITGAIGGIVVATSALAFKIYKRKKIEARFPVAGRYISFFEDIENGTPLVVPSVSEVEQRGNSLKIITEMAGERSWTLEGTIMQGGHVSGVYSADAVYDDGVGSFYLKISKDSLDGMWNGYDHQNKMTNSGRYWFRRILPVSIEKATSTDINDILHTSGNVFGYGYVDKNSIRIDDKHFAIVARINGEFCGFCFGHIEPANQIREMTRQVAGVLPDDVRVADEHGTLGVIKTIAIRKKYRGHGVGTQLLKAAETELLDRGCECIVVPAWSVSGKTNIENLLLNHDYARWFENETYWKDRCEAREFECVSFDGQCQCSVIFYRKGRI